MKLLDTLIEDLKKGENLELYFISIIAIVVLGLDISNKATNEAVLSTILALLALLAFGLIGIKRNLKKNRETNNKLTEQYKINSISQNLYESGIVDILNIRTIEVLRNHFSKAKKEIKILQTWLEGSTPIPREVIEAANRGVDVKILLFNPESELTKIRARDLDFSEERPKILQKDLKTFVGKRKIQKGSIEIRFFDSIPPSFMYFSDDDVIISFPWFDKGSSAGSNLVINNLKSGMGFHLNESFEKLWKKNISEKIELKTK